MKILIIGAGKMGGAIIDGWLSKKLGYDVNIVEISLSRRNFLKKKYPDTTIDHNIPCKWKGDIILLATKPQYFFEVVKKLNEKKINSRFVISIMAGIKLKTIKSALHTETKFIRAMPNLPASIGSGVTSLYSRDIEKKSEKMKVQILFKSLGSVFWIKNEKLFDPMTAIAGSGPAYFFLIFLIMQDTAIKLGLPKKIIKNLILDIAKGAIEISKAKKSFRKLIIDVASPGGTTEAALKVLEKEKPNLNTILSKAILEAYKRSEKIGKNVTK